MQVVVFDDLLEVTSKIELKGWQFFHLLPEREKMLLLSLGGGEGKRETGMHEFF